MIRLLLSRVLPIFHKLNYKLQRRLSNVFVGYELQFLLSGVTAASFHKLNFKLQRRLSNVLPHPTKTSKVTIE